MSIIRIANRVLQATLTTLAVLPLVAGGKEHAIGQITSSRGAYLGGRAVSVRETVNSGDVLSTAKSGKAAVEFAPNVRANLSGETSVRFQADQGRIVAEVISGAFATATAGDDLLTVVVQDYKIEPAKQAKAIYQVAALPDRNLIITVRRGEVSIKDIRSGRSYLLPEGYAAVAQNEAPATGKQPQEKTEEPKRAPDIPAGQSTEKPPPPQVANRKPLLIVLAGGGAAAGIAAAVTSGGGGETPVSPSQP